MDSSDIEMELRIDELRRVEKMISQLPIRIYEEGHQFLYENRDVGKFFKKTIGRKALKVLMHTGELAGT